MIKLFITDIDGTYTNGNMYYNSKGVIDQLFFHTKDSFGFKLLQTNKIKIMFLTSSPKRKSLQKRAKSLKIDYLIENCKNKLHFLFDFIKQNNYTWDDIAYIGDDINDFVCLSNSKYKACPKNAVKLIKEIPNIYISDYYGGQGAIRQFIDYLGDLDENLY